MIDNKVIPTRSDNKNFFLLGNVTNNWYLLFPSLSAKIGIEYDVFLSYLKPSDFTFVASPLL